MLNMSDLDAVVEYQTAMQLLLQRGPGRPVEVSDHVYATLVNALGVLTYVVAVNPEAYHEALAEWRAQLEDALKSTNHG